MAGSQYMVGLWTWADYSILPSTVIGTAPPTFTILSCWPVERSVRRALHEKPSWMQSTPFPFNLVLIGWGNMGLGPFLKTMVMSIPGFRVVGETWFLWETWEPPFSGIADSAARSHSRSLWQALCAEADAEHRRWQRGKVRSRILS